MSYVNASEWKAARRFLPVTELEADALGRPSVRTEHGLQAWFDVDDDGGPSVDELEAAELAWSEADEFDVAFAGVALAELEAA